MRKEFLFVSDLHGHVGKYEKLFVQIAKMKPRAVFFGGDILPAGMLYREHSKAKPAHFITEFLVPTFRKLKNSMGSDYPDVFLIFGNDDPRSEEMHFIEHEQEGLWHYMHMKKAQLDGFTVYGYAMVPPTPFLLKDWERYDVSRFVDPGCVHPIEGYRTVKPEEDIEFATIKQDLETLAGDDDLSKAIFLFHSPPYKTALDRAGLDGVMVDHVPVDVHVGSIAIKEFIEQRQPLLSLHGHIHESSRITGKWKEKINKTMAYSAAYDGPGLALVRFSPHCLLSAERMIL
ncbi:MAG: metallophosphoesterase [Bacteroidales bacterium]|nr:metallophosphoesterase [Bacteroidales bacterium]